MIQTEIFKESTGILVFEKFIFEYRYRNLQTNCLSSLCLSIEAQCFFRNNWFSVMISGNILSIGFKKSQFAFNDPTIEHETAGTIIIICFHAHYISKFQSDLFVRNFNFMALHSRSNQNWLAVVQFCSNLVSVKYLTTSTPWEKKFNFFLNWCSPDFWRLITASKAFFFFC